MHKLHILTCGNSTIGYGHIFRCKALVSQLRNTELHFYATDDLASIIHSANEESPSFHLLHELKDFTDLISKRDYVVLDDYRITYDLVQTIKDKSAGVVFIDDLAQRHMIADIVINPTPNFEIKRYKGALDTQYLIGLDYALLRKPFLDLARHRKVLKNKKIMICFGGSDPKNLTEKTLQIVLTFDFFDHATVVLGPGYQFNNQLKTRFFSRKTSFIENVGEEEMAQLMSEHTFAIYPCSGILLEGIAAKQRIISGYYAENQIYVYQQHLKMNTFEDAKTFEATDLSQAIEKVISSSLIEKTNHYIDGHSMERIQRHFDLLFQMKDFDIRKADDTDMELTFFWANHAKTRQYSFSKKTIEWESHCNWFRKKIMDKNCHFLILENKAKKLGSIRFDIHNQMATISYLICPENHGQGLGTILLKKGLQYLESKKNQIDIRKVTGIVQKSNIASVRAFERFGFLRAVEKDNFVFTKDV